MKPLIPAALFAALSIGTQAGCSSEFVGGGASFAGGSGRKAGKPGSSTSDPESAGDEDGSADATPGGGAGGDGGMGGSDAGSDLVVDEGAIEQCIRHGAGINPVLDFDAPPPGVAAGSQANMRLRGEFEATHGVRFAMSGGYDAVIRRTARLGEAQLPAGEEAWLCIYCDGAPSRNRLVDAAAEASIGRYVLSSTAAALNASATLRVDYRIAVASLSFDLVDVDGDEVWVVEALDAAGQVIAGLSQSVSESGYATGATGNGAATRITVATTDGARDIKGFLIRGDKPTQMFGFGFDNFEPGIPECDD